MNCSFVLTFLFFFLLKRMSGLRKSRENISGLSYEVFLRSYLPFLLSSETDARPAEVEGVWAAQRHHRGGPHGSRFLHRFEPKKRSGFEGMKLKEGSCKNEVEGKKEGRK